MTQPWALKKDESSTVIECEEAQVTLAFPSVQASLRERGLLSVKTGDRVTKTRDLFTFLGFIVLAHEQADQVFTDYQAVKNMESALIIDHACQTGDIAGTE